MTVEALRVTFRLLSRVSPSAASNLAVQLFRTPRRYSTPPRERDAMSGAEPFRVRLGASTELHGWTWGSGPLVVLVHGWEGRGSQMATFAAPLVAAGFRVATYDAPGHGRSTGRKSSLPHFTWALRGVVEALGESPRAVIAHSMGCASTALAVRDGLEVPRLVFIAPPLDPREYTRQFGNMFGLDDSIVDGLRQRVEERFLRPWTDYSLANMAPRMTSRLLVIHDEGDNEVPYAGGAKLAELWPHSTLISTTGLGHRRVLREPAVIEAVLTFVTDNAK